MTNISIERFTMSNGNTHYFDWAIFNSYVELPKGTYGLPFCHPDHLTKPPPQKKTLARRGFPQNRDYVGGLKYEGNGIIYIYISNGLGR